MWSDLLNAQRTGALYRTRIGVANGCPSEAFALCRFLSGAVRSVPRESLRPPHAAPRPSGPVTEEPTRSRAGRNAAAARLPQLPADARRALRGRTGRRHCCRRITFRRGPPSLRTTISISGRRRRLTFRIPVSRNRSTTPRVRKGIPAALPHGAGQEGRRDFAHRDCSWTLTGNPGIPSRRPAPATERTGDPEAVVVVPVSCPVPVAIRGTEVPEFVVPRAADRTRQGDSQTPGTPPERSPGAGAKCLHVRRLHARRTLPHAAFHFLASRAAVRQARAEADGCGSVGHSLPATCGGRRARGRIRETAPTPRSAGSGSCADEAAGADLRGKRRSCPAIPPAPQGRRGTARSRRHDGDPSRTELSCRSGRARRDGHSRRIGWSGCRWEARGGARKARTGRRPDEVDGLPRIVDDPPKPGCDGRRRGAASRASGSRGRWPENGCHSAGHGRSGRGTVRTEPRRSLALAVGVAVVDEPPPAGPVHRAEGVVDDAVAERRGRNDAVHDVAAARAAAPARKFPLEPEDLSLEVGGERRDTGFGALARGGAQGHFPQGGKRGDAIKQVASPPVRDGPRSILRPVSSRERAARSYRVETTEAAGTGTAASRRWLARVGRGGPGCRSPGTPARPALSTPSPSRNFRLRGKRSAAGASQRRRR